MDHNQKRYLSQIEKQKRALLDGKADISLTHILSSERCQSLFSECREFRDRVYTPLKTVFSFIKQVLNPDKSCKKAVAGVVVERLSKGQKKVSSNTGPYCKARQRLPEELLYELVKEVGKAPLKNAPRTWKPYGREVKAFDGSTGKAADTPENQQVFPQLSSQQKGIGFPLLRFTTVISLTTGTVLDYVLGTYSGKGSGEPSMLREMLDCIEAGDIAVGDRYFTSFFLIADLSQRGADVIFRGCSHRVYDFRRGDSLGKNDHVVVWGKSKKPDWMDKKKYDAYPAEMQIREFKVGGTIYVTTLLNPKKYHKKELARIYRRRWEIEITLKNIKDIMGMDRLSCKTPEMVRKEIGIHFLAYNFIRIIMAEACVKHEAIPWKISFKGSVQLLNEFMPHFICASATKNRLMYAEMLRLIVKNRVGNRPGRVEPRAVKQRPKCFAMLNKPRSIEKMRLMKQIERRILRYAEA